MTQLDEIRARLEKATPGPWQYNGDMNRIECGDDVLFETTSHRPPLEIVANAELIAHAPEDIRLLLAENDRLRNIMRQAKGADMFTPMEGPTKAEIQEMAREALTNWILETDNEEHQETRRGLELLASGNWQHTTAHIRNVTDWDRLEEMARYYGQGTI